MFLFPDHQVGYRDSPGQPYEDIDNTSDPDKSFWNVVPFPESPRGLKQQELEHEELSPEKEWSFSDDSDLFIPESEQPAPSELDLNLETLAELTPQEVMYEMWREYIKATGVHIKFLRVWVHVDAPVPVGFQISPLLIRQQWRPNELGDPPAWVSWREKKFYHRIVSRQSAVRALAHLSRKEVNAAVSNDIVDWVRAMTLDPDGGATEPAGLIWSVSTPKRRPTAESSRKHAHRYRTTIIDENGVFGIE